MKIITLRVDDELYDQIYNISKQTSTSLNKTTKNIIADYLKSPRTTRLKITSSASRGFFAEADLLIPIASR